MNVVTTTAVVVFLTSIIGITGSVKVSVYYEALCPDSTRFIALQLYPNYSKFKDYIQLDLIPYGKATHNLVDNVWKFECQHGPEECKGNKFQSCALAQSSGRDKSLALVNCIMRKRNPSNAGDVQDCVNRNGFNWNKIKTCAENSEGDNLLASNGNKTNMLEPSISFVPTIVFDDVYDAVFQELSLTDFVTVLCHNIPAGAKPSACANKRLPERKSFWDAFER